MGPVFALILLIFSDSEFVPRPLRPNGTPVPNEFSQQHRSTSGGKSNDQAEPGGLGKKRASRIPGGLPMRAFLLHDHRPCFRSSARPRMSGKEPRPQMQEKHASPPRRHRHGIRVTWHRGIIRILQSWDQQGNLHGAKCRLRNARWDFSWDSCEYGFQNLNFQRNP
jgi:hypothetical protein